MHFMQLLLLPWGRGFRHLAGLIVGTKGRPPLVNSGIEQEDYIMADHNAVAHNWAHQTGRARKGFNMFYEGNTIYSYGYHFPIARMMTAPNGERVVLFTQSNYSVSTSKHKTIVQRALGYDREDILYVPKLDAYSFDAAGNWDRVSASLEELALKWKRARGLRALHASAMAEAIATANRIAILWQLDKPRLEMPEDIGAWVAEADERRKEEQRQKDLKDRETIQKWLKGEPVRPPHTRIPYVRVLEDKLQTSWGVTISLKKALRLYRLAVACARCRHEFVPAKDHRIDGWAINRVSADGTVHVGCHVIPLKVQHEAARLAGILRA